MLKYFIKEIIKFNKGILYVLKNFTYKTVNENLIELYKIWTNIIYIANLLSVSIKRTSNLDNNIIVVDI